MEDRALYHAILAAPHDDAPRLVYADWLDDRAATEPDLPARRLRARAELIRVQVALARSGAGGWKRDNPRPPELVARERRLLFRIGRKLRGEVPVGMASAPFDRGFLRPFRALRPHEFLSPLEDVSRPFMARFPYRSRLPELLPDGADPWNAAPLWDVHLFASTWHNDPEADTGQYGSALDEVGQSARMERVGWLKVSFARTPVLNFLRHGRFPNVETLVLNSGPFPQVLHAVAENESFRSLRYVQFGNDEWVWVWGQAARERFREAATSIQKVNDTHPTFGAMRAALGAVAGAARGARAARTVEPQLTAPIVPPRPVSPNAPARVNHSSEEVSTVKGCVFAFVVVAGLVAALTPSPPPKKLPQFNTNLNTHELKPEVLEALKNLQKASDQRPVVGPPRPRE